VSSIRETPTRSRRGSSGPPDSALDLAAASACSLAIAAVPVLSYQEGLSYIPQLLALLSLLTVATKVARQYPKGVGVHRGMIAYGTLVLLFGFTLLEDPGIWNGYLTLIKVFGMALAAHFAFRSPKTLVILFGTYCLAAVITVAANWSDLQDLHYAFETGAMKGQRFSGTFGNANTAALYGIMTSLSALIVVAGSKFKMRWLILCVGLGCGMLLVYFSGSRKGMLGLMLLALFSPFIVFEFRKIRLTTVLKFAALVPVLLFGAWTLIVALPNSQRLTDLFTEGADTDGSTAERYAMLIDAIKLWLKNPILGSGYDGFARHSAYGVYSHSTFAEILCNAGIVGMICIIIFYVFPVWDLARLIIMSNLIGLRSLHVGLLGFWILFGVFSIFSVLFEARDFIPMGAAITGYLVATRRRRFPSQGGKEFRRKAQIN
jgi:O-antigen ligase